LENGENPEEKKVQTVKSVFSAREDASSKDSAAEAAGGPTYIKSGIEGRTKVGRKQVGS